MSTETAPLARIRGWLQSAGYGAVVLTRPQNVGWLTRGTNTPIDRTSAQDPVWFVITALSVTAVTTTIEADRVREEVRVAGSTAFDITSVPWYAADYRSSALSVVSGSVRVASDDSAVGVDAGDDLIALRMILDATEQASLRTLGREATLALETALAEWHPGETDFEVQAAIIRTLEATGIQAPIIIVGGDDRLSRFRHPLAVGAPMNERVMAVIVARQEGLHVAVTRFADAQPAPVSLVEASSAVRAIETETLRALVPGTSYGQVLEAMADAYAAAGYAGAWREHYQGGPIGFDQREFEIAPGDTGSRWFSHPVEIGHAVAFNPSLRGGAKVEDTYLITVDGPVLVTDSGTPGIHT
jgi:Xaa-Pro dipeptidase